MSFKDDWDDISDDDDLSELDDFEADLESGFEDWDYDDWDEIADEYDDYDVFEWFSKLS